MKRYTTTGMATDQGKTSNLNALGDRGGDLGGRCPQVGLTTFRMPYTPVTFGIFAGYDRGDLFDPVRTTPIARVGAQHTAPYSRTSASGSARDISRGRRGHARGVARECRAVRAACGMFDASTLGKIEVVGPDAGDIPVAHVRE